MNTLKLLIPISFACFCNASANTLWKMQFSKNPINFSSISAILMTIFSMQVIGGMILYTISMVLFFYLLSNYKLSEVIPLTCLTYVFNLIAAYFIFREKLLPTQIIGIFIIISGIVVFSR